MNAALKLVWHYVNSFIIAEKTEKENIKSEIDSIMKDQLTLKEIEKKVESLKIDHQVCFFLMQKIKNKLENWVYFYYVLS